MDVCTARSSPVSNVQSAHLDSHQPTNATRSVVMVLSGGMKPVILEMMELIRMWSLAALIAVKFRMDIGVRVSHQFVKEFVVMVIFRMERIVIGECCLLMILMRILRVDVLIASNRMASIVISLLVFLFAVMASSLEQNNAILVATRPQVVLIASLMMAGSVREHHSRFVSLCAVMDSLKVIKDVIMGWLRIHCLIR